MISNSTVTKIRSNAVVNTIIRHTTWVSNICFIYIKRFRKQLVGLLVILIVLYRMVGFREVSVNEQLSENSYNEYLPMGYRAILQKDTKRVSMDEKCRVYFNSMEGTLEPIELGELQYNREELDLDIYLSNRMRDYRDKQYEIKRVKFLAENPDIEDPTEQLNELKLFTSASSDDIEQFRLDHQKSLVRNHLIENEIIEGLTHLKVYGKCYLERPQEKFMKDTKDIVDCSVLQQKLFPWQTGNSPVFERWNGEIHTDFPSIVPEKKSDSVNFYVTQNHEGYLFNEDEVELPNQNEQQERKAEKKPEAEAPRGKHHDCFVNDLHLNYRGKGIVFTASDKYVSDLLSLIKVLRAFNNKLPIQIIHKGDLSRNSRDRIINVAREKLELPYSYHKVSSTVSSEFSKQDVWFVNVEKCITSKYSKHFEHFANKLLASFFNSFQEMILMDTDVIPLINPVDFFHTKQYNKSGTYFFKDREQFELQKAGDPEFFSRILPLKADEYLFGIPGPTNKTLENRFFKYKYLHFMEAGLVVLNKTQHLTGLLATIQLQLFEPSATRVWGDKELFWLGLVVAGDENYEFNRDSAYAVGELSADNLRFSRASKYFKEVCSSHPGHVNEDGQLLWLNSGFKNCKNLDTYEMDSKSNKLRKLFGIKKNPVLLQKKLKYYYNLPTRINFGILPTVDMRLYRLSVAKGTQISVERSWKKRLECLGYLWCGYISNDENIITDENYSLQYRGKIIEFDDNTKSISEFLGDLWISNYVKGYRLSDEVEVELTDDLELLTGNED